MARRLAWRWEVPRLGEPAAEEEAPLPWRIVTKAFREDLEWAIVLRCEEEEVSVAVQELLNGLAARGIEIERG